jgi:hypothetical protein
MSFKEFANELNGKRVEGELVKTVIYSLLTSTIFLAIVYYLKLKDVSGFFDKYAFFLFLSALSFALIVPTLRQVRAYKQFNCMSGMMIGMTSGMIAGFLPGFYVGATNGMFIGGVFGMLVGIIFGIWTGKCCGIMGFMEGIMAGFMGGWMGAMTSVMLLNDHLRIASVIVFIVSAIIMASLNYMIYGEMKENERQIVEDHWSTIIVTFVLITITTWLMIFGLKGGAI